MMYIYREKSRQIIGQKKKIWKFSDFWTLLFKYILKSIFLKIFKSRNLDCLNVFVVKNNAYTYTDLKRIILNKFIEAHIPEQRHTYKISTDNAKLFLKCGNNHLPSKIVYNIICSPNLTTAFKKSYIFFWHSNWEMVFCFNFSYNFHIFIGFLHFLFWVIIFILYHFLYCFFFKFLKYR